MKVQTLIALLSKEDPTSIARGMRQQALAKLQALTEQHAEEVREADGDPDLIPEPYVDGYVLYYFRYGSGPGEPVHEGFPLIIDDDKLATRLAKGLSKISGRPVVVCYEEWDFDEPRCLDSEVVGSTGAAA
jgi:hypothetical protein